MAARRCQVEAAQSSMAMRVSSKAARSTGAVAMVAVSAAGLTVAASRETSY